jgi:hypothetical protein
MALGVPRLPRASSSAWSLAASRASSSIVFGLGLGLGPVLIELYGLFDPMFFLSPAPARAAGSPGPALLYDGGGEWTLPLSLGASGRSHCDLPVARSMKNLVDC